MQASNNKGIALRSYGELLIYVSRYEKAEQTYASAVAAFEEALSRAPDYTYTRYNRGVALQSRGEVLATLSRREEAEQTYADAVYSFNEALKRAPDLVDAHYNKGTKLVSRGDLLMTHRATGKPDRTMPMLWQSMMRNCFVLPTTLTRFSTRC